MAGPYQYVLGPVIEYNDADYGRYYGPPAECVSWLDLRSIPEQSALGQTGVGFFTMPATWARPSEYTLVGGGMGDLRELSFSALDASAWQSLVGPVISRNGSTKLSDALLEQFTDSADPTGSEWNKPIIPGVYSPSETLEAEIVLPGHSRIASRVFLGFKANRWGSHIRDIIRRDLDEYENTPAAGRLQDKWLEVWGGYTQKYFGRHDRAGAAELLATRMKPVAAGRKPRKPKTSYTDNFDRADGAMGASWYSYQSGAATIAISSNQCVITWSGAAANREMARYEADVSSPDHWCLLTLTGGTGSGSNTGWGPCVRFSDSTRTCYFANIYASGIVRVQPWKIISGTVTSLGFGNTVNGTKPIPGKAQVSGSSFTVSAKNAGVTTVTDTSISAGTRGGLASRNVLSGIVTVIMDDWSIDDGVTGGAVGPAIGHFGKTIGGRILGGSVLT
jgi:hypothetical protein